MSNDIGRPVTSNGSREDHVYGPALLTQGQRDREARIPGPGARREAAAPPHPPLSEEQEVLRVSWRREILSAPRHRQRPARRGQGRGGRGGSTGGGESRGLLEPSSRHSPRRPPRLPLVSARPAGGGGSPGLAQKLGSRAEAIAQVSGASCETPSSGAPDVGRRPRAHS